MTCTEVTNNNGSWERSDEDAGSIHYHHKWCDLFLAQAARNQDHEVRWVTAPKEAQLLGERLCTSMHLNSTLRALERLWWQTRQRSLPARQSAQDDAPGTVAALRAGHLGCRRAESQRKACGTRLRGFAGFGCRPHMCCPGSVFGTLLALGGWLGALCEQMSNESRTHIEAQQNTGLY